MKTNSDHHTRKADHSLPRLEDPDHPGIFLISRIVLFSVALFLTLISLAFYATTSVSLNFELPLNGIMASDHIVLYAETSKASVIEPGDKANVVLDNGDVMEAEVVDIRIDHMKGNKRNSIVLKPAKHSEDASPYHMKKQRVGQPLSATVFTRSRTLWSFIRDKTGFWPDKLP
ncbi:hypothetical protein FNH22_18900 [Fulvivirga sp. M361]|uniref:hypothetical protein n=1 Tax=Fulvivirga sp. M361 TaxID=2594266 RepID=UPI00117B1A01|nr:hypothetical protein [Fulvivirga sp. M361]TRX54824.1 hypothetical protein FNH22_18900 [Fulvivirga sp. M361]